jgi:hypothetical protein
MSPPARQNTTMLFLRRRSRGRIPARHSVSSRADRPPFLADALRTTGTATLLGVLGALAMSRVLAGLLVGVSPHDPLSLAGAATVTLCAGSLGCLLAARRAARTSPADALRH